MYLLKFSAYNGAVKLEKLFKQHRDAVMAGFALTADRPDGVYSISYVEVNNEQ